MSPMRRWDAARPLGKSSPLALPASLRSRQRFSGWPPRRSSSASARTLSCTDHAMTSLCLPRFGGRRPPRRSSAQVGGAPPIVADGSHSARPPPPQQLFDIPDDDRAARLVAADAEYCRSRAGPSGEPPHLRFRLLRTVRRDFCVGSCFKAIYVGQQLASPMVLRLLVGAVAQNSNIGVVWAVVLVRWRHSPPPGLTACCSSARAHHLRPPLFALVCRLSSR